MKRIDLHTHSSASDGSCTPTQLIEAAAAAGLSAVALTDHDTMAGVPEAMEAAKVCGIECIPGIELSAVWGDGDIHIVGLFLDPKDPILSARLNHFQELRDGRNLKMVQKMQAAGIDISLEKLRKTDGDAVITRGNLARYLLRIGYVASIQEAFEKYLSPGMAFFVPKTGVTPEDAVKAICDGGGRAILAHPLLYHFSPSELETCVNLLKSYGLSGIETYYSSYTDADMRDMKRFADRHQLLYSGGSDFHGNVKPHIQIGKGRGNLVIPYEVLDNLRL
jgi:hypothetical protein